MNVNKEKEYNIPYENLNNGSIPSLDEYSDINPIREFIFDDIVKTAESLSILANIPLAGKYNEELIVQLSLIQKYIEQVENSKTDVKRRNV